MMLNRAIEICGVDQDMVLAAGRKSEGVEAKREVASYLYHHSAIPVMEIGRLFGLKEARLGRGIFDFEVTDRDEIFDPIDRFSATTLAEIGGVSKSYVHQVKLGLRPASVRLRFIADASYELSRLCRDEANPS